MTFNEWVSTYWMWGLLGLGFAFLPYIRKVSTYYATLIHEIGHGISSLNPTGGLGAISIKPDSSGENMVSYRGGSLLFMPIRIGSLMAGYAAPVYAGILFIATTVFDLGNIFKWVIGIVCILTLLAIRNLFGALIILLHAGFWTLIVIFDFIPMYPTLVTLGFILISRGLADYIEVAKYSFVPQYKGMGTDFDLLQQEFLLPRQVWFVMFTLGHSVILFILLVVAAGADSLPRIL